MASTEDAIRLQNAAAATLVDIDKAEQAFEVIDPTSPMLETLREWRAGFQMVQAGARKWMEDWWDSDLRIQVGHLTYLIDDSNPDPGYNRMHKEYGLFMARAQQRLYRIAEAILRLDKPLPPGNDKLMRYAEAVAKLRRGQASPSSAAPTPGGEAQAGIDMNIVLGVTGVAGLIAIVMQARR